MVIKIEYIVLAVLGFILAIMFLWGVDNAMDDAEQEARIAHYCKSPHHFDTFCEDMKK